MLSLKMKLVFFFNFIFTFPENIIKVSFKTWNSVAWTKTQTFIYYSIITIKKKELSVKTESNLERPSWPLQRQALYLWLAFLPYLHLVECKWLSPLWLQHKPWQFWVVLWDRYYTCSYWQLWEIWSKYCLAKVSKPKFLKRCSLLPLHCLPQDLFIECAPRHVCYSLCWWPIPCTRFLSKSMVT